MISSLPRARAVRYPSATIRSIILFAALSAVLPIWAGLRVAQAQSGVPSIKTDFAVYAAPVAPALPPAGGRLTDPTFGTEVLRATDERDGPECGTIYSNWHTFNRDSTRLLYRTASGPHLADFDPAGFAVTNKRPVPLINGNAGVLQDGAAWSYLDRDVLYTVGYGSRLYALNAATGAYTLVADLARLGAPGLDLAANAITTMHMDGRDEVFAFRLQSRAT